MTSIYTCALAVVLTETRGKVAARAAIDCIDRALRVGVHDEITADHIESVERLAVAMMATTAAILRRPA